MAKTSELAGVAHNVAHHASSGLSYLSPHLSQALKGVGASTTSVELLTDQPYPSNVAQLEPLRLAFLSLRQTVISLLATHGFSDVDVTSVVLHATPAPWDGSGYSLHTRAVVAAANGRTFDSGWLS
jgi:hypothetical protein